MVLTTQSAAASPPWFAKYEAPGTNGSSLTVLDFREREVSEADWAAALAAEQQEVAARPAAMRAAEQAKYEVLEVPNFTLKDGHRMPAVGLGTWKAEKGQVREAVHCALQAGYRHIDCASCYQNEDEVGEALEYSLLRGLVQRQDLFICSKVWNTDHAAARVRTACLKSLAALRLSYLDLYLIHWPVTGSVGPALTPSIKETWQALEGLVREGLVRSIGVSNFSVRKMQEVLSYATVPLSVCQVEVHPYHRNDALLTWSQAQGIHVTAYSPLGSPDSASIFPRKKPLVLLDDPVVKQIGTAVGRDPGQVLVRWALQHGTSVIPKSTSPARIRGNLRGALGWELSPEQYAALSSLAFQQRMVNGAMWLNPRGPYRTMEELWDEPELE